MTGDLDRCIRHIGGRPEMLGVFCFPCGALLPMAGVRVTRSKPKPCVLGLALVALWRWSIHPPPRRHHQCQRHLARLGTPSHLCRLETVETSGHALLRLDGKNRSLSPLLRPLIGSTVLKITTANTTTTTTNVQN